jgi:hypothetical protein
MRPGPDRLPGPLRQQPGRHQPAHRLGQRIVVSLVPGPVIVRGDWGGQGGQHPADQLGALRREIPVHHAGAAECGRQLQGPVAEVPVRVLIRQLGPGPLVHLREQRRQFLQPQSRGRGPEEHLVGVVPVLFRQFGGPQADQPAQRFGDLLGGQRRDHTRMGGDLPGPGGVPDGGAPGDPGAVHQPGHRAVLGVVGVPLPRGKYR